jgi:hypothetical protein
MYPSFESLYSRELLLPSQISIQPLRMPCIARTACQAAQLAEKQATLHCLRTCTTNSENNVSHQAVPLEYLSKLRYYSDWLTQSALKVALSYSQSPHRHSHPLRLMRLLGEDFAAPNLVSHSRLTELKESQLIGLCHGLLESCH